MQPLKSIDTVMVGVRPVDLINGKIWCEPIETSLMITERFKFAQSVGFKLIDEVRILQISLVFRLPAP